MCQSGCSFVTATRKSEPSDDWCIIGNTSPSARTTGNARSTIARSEPARPRMAFGPSSRQVCRMGGDTSIQRTAVYAMTQSATSSSPEFQLNPKRPPLEKSGAMGTRHRFQ